jgi:hypothetical protein
MDVICFGSRRYPRSALSVNKEPVSSRKPQPFSLPVGAIGDIIKGIKPHRKGTTDNRLTTIFILDSGDESALFIPCEQIVPVIRIGWIEGNGTRLLTIWTTWIEEIKRQSGRGRWVAPLIWRGCTIGAEDPRTVGGLQPGCLLKNLQISRRRQLYPNGGALDAAQIGRLLLICCRTTEADWHRAVDDIIPAIRATLILVLNGTGQRSGGGSVRLFLLPDSSITDLDLGQLRSLCDRHIGGISAERVAFWRGPVCGFLRGQQAIKLRSSAADTANKICNLTACTWRGYRCRAL